MWTPDSHEALGIIVFCVGCKFVLGRLPGAGCHPATGSGGIYQRQQQACYQRFSVNDCLTQARRERREVLDELRRRELLLNELERQTQAIDAINRIQDKLSPERQQQLADQAEQARLQALERQARNNEKNAERLNAPMKSTPRTPEDPSAIPPSDSAQFERAYLDKLAEAQKRRADLEKRLRQQGKAADSLPVPN